MAIGNSHSNVEDNCEGGGETENKEEDQGEEVESKILRQLLH